MNTARQLGTLQATLLVVLCGIPEIHAAAAVPPESSAVRQLFSSPTRDYATAPLWVWNDMLTEKQIRETMRDLASQQVRQVFVHPRPGLMTPYLSKDWFQLWRVALREAERLDMNVWIYDENSYPSGFAGGWVPEVMPESRGRGLALREEKKAPKWSGDMVAVYRKKTSPDTDYENVTAKARAGEDLGEGRFVTATVRRSGNSPWHGNRSYVDLLYPGVTEKFLEITMEPYRKELGSEFGKRVPGVFTDEPNINPAGPLPWTEDLPRQFQERRGYDLLEHLPSLTQASGDWRKIRHDYFRTLNELFIERWAKPYYDYCERNGLEFTGHYWDHEWPNCAGVPDNMAMYAWHQRPSIDCLMNQYAEHTHAQFGNVRMVRELQSVANQFERPRTLCELYGAGGWDLRFEDMKRIGDWLQVLGVNTMDEHLSYITLRGARKRDHPQSFSYHEPWWGSYHVVATYLTRISAALSQGRQVNRVLVLEPTTTAWMYQGEGAGLQRLGSSFFNLLMDLERQQVEYDLGCEDIITRHGSSERDQFVVAKRSYHTVVVPPATETLCAKTVSLLSSFLNNGGTVLCAGDAPPRVDGGSSEQAAALTRHATWKRVEPGKIPELLKPTLARDRLAITRATNDAGILFHHRRELKDGELLFLVNTSIETPSRGTIESAAAGIEVWDPVTGSNQPYAFRPGGKSVRAEFMLPASGSLLLFLSKAPLTSAPPRIHYPKVLQARGAMEVRRVEPNVLTLDYVTITAGGETRSNIYVYHAGQFAFQKNGMARNPWDSAVQFRDELITNRFPAKSGFEASYQFVVSERVPDNLAVVVERPDLYSITCNGKTVRAKKGQWWLDKAFGKIDLGRAARVGTNVVVLRASPFTIFHELEAAYLLGDFSLVPSASGFTIAPDQPLRIVTNEGPSAHGNNPDGAMWLSGGVGFEGQAMSDRAPFVVFDLGQPIELGSIKIWNYNENHVRDLTSRAANRVRLSGSQSADGSWEVAIGTFSLPRPNGREVMPEVFKVRTKGIRFVRCEILGNHNGATFPLGDGPVADNAFVGLSEVEFDSQDGETVKGVKISAVSSELVSHRRPARHLVDRSGLADARVGWNQQGHPFYSAGVSYRQTYTVSEHKDRAEVVLPDWHGSVARVRVNGKEAGHIWAPPWSCDVSRLLKTGDNEIVVTVIGTLKNTLGPHHGRPGLGSAWPGMFHQGPDPGPPPGNQYHTVAYGLFEPFQVVQTSSRPVIKTQDVQVGMNK